MSESWSISGSGKPTACDLLKCTYRMGKVDALMVAAVASFMMSFINTHNWLGCSCTVTLAHKVLLCTDPRGWIERLLGKCCPKKEKKEARKAARRLDGLTTVLRAPLIWAVTRRAAQI